MQIQIWDIIILFGSIQGFILGTLVLYKSSRKPRSNHLMAGLLYIFSLATLGMYIGQSPLIETERFLYLLHKYFPFHYVILIGPIIYLFTRTEIDPGFSFSRAEKHHFYLVLWGMIPQILEMTKSIGLYFDGLSTTQVGFLDTLIAGFFRYGDVFLWLVLTSYLVSALGVYKQYKSSPRTLWLGQFLNIFIFFQFTIWLPLLLIFVSPFHFLIHDLGGRYELIYIPLVVLIYWVGVKWAVDAPPLTFKSPAKKEIEKKYSQELIAHCIRDLTQVMKEQKPYLQRNLNLDQLSSIVGTKPTTLTYVLNQEMGLDFKEYIDSFRVAHASNLLRDAMGDKPEIEKIAFDSGFNSPFDFKRIFYRFHELSPKEFIRLHKNSRQVQEA